MCGRMYTRPFPKIYFPSKRKRDGRKANSAKIPVPLPTPRTKIIAVELVCFVRPSFEPPESLFFECVQKTLLPHFATLRTHRSPRGRMWLVGSTTNPKHGHVMYSYSPVDRCSPGTHTKAQMWIRTRRWCSPFRDAFFQFFL